MGWRGAMAHGNKSDWDYRGLAAEAYDLWFGDEPYVDQAFYADKIRELGGTSLEIACGTGRLLIPYVRDGLDVEGVDASAEMLAICRDKAQRAGVKPVLHQQLMQELDTGCTYRTVFIPFCSFQILARRDEAFAALERFRHHLEPGGRLLVSLFVPWTDFAVDGQWRLRRSATRPADGATVLIHECTRSDRFEQLQRIWLRLEVYEGGRRTHVELRMHTLRWYHQHEFALMLEHVGFREVRVFHGYADAGEPDPEGEMVFSARRPA